MLSLFRVATGEDWTDIMYINMYGCNKYGYSDDHDLPQPKDCTKPASFEVGSALFFVFFMVVGSLVLLNLFLGIITTAMDDAHATQKIRDIVEAKIVRYRREQVTVKVKLQGLQSQ